jgi:hypothetical protein
MELKPTQKLRWWTYRYSDGWGRSDPRAYKTVLQQWHEAAPTSSDGVKWTSSGEWVEIPSEVDSGTEG